MSPQRAFHQLRVAEVVSETDDACSLVLAVPPELSGEFAYRPGQFLTVRVPHNGAGSVARCYSLSSSPHTGDRLTITVKRVADGYASNWLADNVTAGSTLDTLPPAGTFTPRSLDTDFLMFAGGSGITPVMSIVKSALARGQGRIVLIYTNRDERSVIFSRELGGWPRRPVASCSCCTGWIRCRVRPPRPRWRRWPPPMPLTRPSCAGPIPTSPSPGRPSASWACPAQRIHTERFLSLAENPFEVAREPAGGVAATLDVTLDGERRVLPWPAGTRMLDALLDEGLDAPFSCRQGICGACACQLTSGEVRMAHNEVLEDEDVAEGYILACQAVPLTDTVSVTYQ